ncbi:MAG: hypothetical protein ACC651_13820 [Candidatus Scalindua sp.]
MNVIEAIIIDQTHLELSQPISAKMGDSIQIIINEVAENESLWHKAAKEHFFDAYDEKDSLSDNL